MCGIVGCLGFNSAYDVIIKSLSLLEYRGYDSVGIGLFNNGKIEEVELRTKHSDIKKEL